MLEGPVLLKHTLRDFPLAKLDDRPDPERFTIREAVAHLADWETVYQERFRAILEETDPLLPNIDEGKRAIERNYASLDPSEQLDLFVSRRTQTVELLKPLPVEAWARKGNRPEIGNVSLVDLVQLLPLHDLYHIKQARELV